jgi:hypothetical protein
MKFVALLLTLAVLGAGCGSDEENESAPPPTLLPRATAVEEWAVRVVNRLMRPTNRDIEVLTTLNNPQTKLFILQGNPETLNIINTRMNDLAKCSDRLVTIGPPPIEDIRVPQLRRLEAALQEACAHYVKVSKRVRLAVRLMSSGRSDVIERGERELRKAGPDATAGAKAYDEAFKIALKIPEFRFFGVKPPG